MYHFYFGTSFIFYYVFTNIFKLFCVKLKKTTRSKKMNNKKIFALLIFLSLLIGIFSNTVYAIETEDATLAWYIKRNGNKQPKLSPEQEIIKAYNAFYIDLNLSDESEKKTIYLTYDAGYENGNIEKTLDILKSECVPAAFFILDNIVLKNTDLVTRMASEGHLICNHTKNHKDLSLFTQEEIKNNLFSLEKICEEKTGFTMSKYFRFPEGKYTERTLKCVNDLGYTTIFWSFAYDDWDNGRQMSEEKAFKKVMSNTHNGAVILFHPTSETNVKILPRLIKEWKKQGYSFGTLDELTK